MITFLVLMAVVACLVGFIILQRRNPDEADKIASGLDSAAKRAGTAVKNEFDKLTRKDK